MVVVRVVFVDVCDGATRASSVAALSRFGFGMTRDEVGVDASGVVAIELSADMSVSLAPGVELCDERSMRDDGLGDTSIASSSR